MKILVTGGAGFIGSHIVEAFVQAGHAVSVVDDLSSGFREHVCPDARFFQLDIRDPRLDELFRDEKPEVVCHQAARANVRESMEQPLLYASVNVLGSLNLLECCRRHGVRKVVYASTGGAVYGEPTKLPVPEDHPINPLDPYGASKHAVEHYLYLYQRHYGLEYTTLRYPNVYGPRQNPFGEAGVVAIFANLMLRGGHPIINGNGTQERDFVYIEDVVRANLLASTAGDGETCNIGSSVGTSVNRIFELLAFSCQYPHGPEYGPPKAGEVSRICLDAGRARQKLGWEPLVDLEEGVRRTVAYFRTCKRDWARPSASPAMTLEQAR